MSLTWRFSAVVLSVLGVSLLAFSITLYIGAVFYLDRQLADRLTGALDILAAAAEVHPNDVEWEPQERVLPLGQESGEEHIRWIVLDDEGKPIDHSRNLADSDLAKDWVPRVFASDVPERLADDRGRGWRVAQLRILPGKPASGSQVVAKQPAAAFIDPPEAFYPALVVTVLAPLGPMQTILARLGWFLFALTIGIWLIAALLCHRLSRRALRPLTRMVASADGLDATETGWTLELAGTRDELDRLGRAFNELLSRLHDAFQRERRFSADASHQLRTPLTVMIGQIEVALLRDRPGDEYRRVLKAVLSQAVHLARIVEALLYLGRSEAEALPVAEPLELDCWLAAYLAERELTGATATIIHHARGEGTLWIECNPALLGQMLDNLLDNAEKYGPADAPAVVETFRDGSHAVLAIEDSGPGIDAKDLPHIFEPFYRSPDVRRRGTPGVGLGLAVVRRIVLAFGGSIEIHGSPRGGSRFEVRLLLHAPSQLSISEPADLIERPTVESHG